MAFKNSLRDRAIASWFKITKNDKDDPHLDLFVSKSRTNKTITVRDNCIPKTIITWSYKNGGKLERIV